MPKEKKPRFRQCKGSLDDAVSGFFGIIEELAEEMREAYDNTPENLQQAGVGEARGEAADALENITSIDVPDILSDGNFEVEWSEDLGKGRRGLSRAARRDNACSSMGAAIDKLNNLVDDVEAIKQIVTEHTDKSIDAVKEAISELASDLETAKDEAEGVDFPGMFG